MELKGIEKLILELFLKEVEDCFWIFLEGLRETFQNFALQ